MTFKNRIEGTLEEIRELQGEEDLGTHKAEVWLRQATLVAFYLGLNWLTQYL